MAFTLFFADQVGDIQFYRYKYGENEFEEGMAGGMIRIEDGLMSVVPQIILQDMQFSPENDYVAMVAADAIKTGILKQVPPRLRTKNGEIELKDDDSKESILARI